MELKGVPVFVCGPLCHLPLLAAVLGRNPGTAAARLAGYRIEGRDWPVLVADPGGSVPGLLLSDLTDDDTARLAFYGGGGAWQAGVVMPQNRPPQISVRFQPGDGDGEGVWNLEAWRARFGATAVATAGDMLALYGQRGAAEVAARRMAMLVRGSSRARAATDVAPATLRRVASDGDVALSSYRQPYAKFFAIDEYDLAFRRFDGNLSENVTRAAFVSGDAVTVLPYDPLRDRVMLVEQFRAGAYARGDRNPWSLEAIAGRIDPGETPEEAARREAAEEAGLQLGQMLHVADYYPSPGAKSEYLYSYVALADLPDSAAGMGGVEEEAEDIKGHVVGFARMMELIASGEIGNAPLILTAFWLQRERERLRSGK